MASIAVFGAGSWGTALALSLARNGHDLSLWGRDAAHRDALRADRGNRRYLPDAPFPPNLRIVDGFEAARDAEQILVVVPSHAFRGTLVALQPHLPANTGLAWATKGLELETGLMLHQVAADVLGGHRASAVLSGPTFARELGANLPSAMTVASGEKEFAQTWAGLLHNNRFRVYTSEDIIGVQLGGATKNVMAIAAGVADGLGFGANARAALITRGLAEMIRLGLAMGGKPETFMGLAGVGDLMLTCTDNQSRNRRFGLGLGQGKPRAQVVQEIGQEIEGILTAKVIHQLAVKQGVDMPITEQTYRILHEALPAIEAVENLLLREPKSEAIR